MESDFQKWTPRIGRKCGWNGWLSPSYRDDQNMIIDMNYENDCSCDWTVVVRRKRKGLSKKKEPKWLEHSSLNSQSVGYLDEERVRDSTVSTINQGKLYVVASPCKNLESLDSSQVVRKLLLEVFKLKERAESSHWWRHLSKLLSSQGLINRNEPSPMGRFPNFVIEAEPDSRKRIGNLICYGLGSFEKSIISRYQLALAKVLQECIIGDKQSADKSSGFCSIYDPVMSAVDIELCKRLGFMQFDPAISQSPSSSPIAYMGTNLDSCSLFFMPHCGRSLYNAVLKEYWCRSRLSKVVILGNSFSFYQTFGRVIDSDSYLGVAIGWMKELKCPDAKFSPLYEAFNDLSVHVFPVECLPPESDPIWNRILLEISAD